MAALALTMFANTSNINDSKNITLDSVIGLASANAEDGFDCGSTAYACDSSNSTYSDFVHCMFWAGCL